MGLVPAQAFCASQSRAAPYGSDKAAIEAELDFFVKECFGVGVRSTVCSVATAAVQKTVEVCWVSLDPAAPLLAYSVSKLCENFCSYVKNLRGL